MWIHSRLCGVIVCSLFAKVALGTPFQDPLSFAEAQRLALEQSEKLKVSDSSRRAAEEVQSTAAELPDPVLRLGLDNVPTSGMDKFTLDKDFMTMTRIGLMQEFTRGSKRKLRRERAGLEVAIAEATAEMTRAEVEREVALAWLRVYYADRELLLVKGQAEEAQAAAIAVQSAYAQGRGGSTDVLLARSQAARMREELARAEQQLRTARIGLARWIGDQAQRAMGSRPGIDTLPLHAHDDLGVLEEQLREHPDIVLLDKQLAAARTDAELARAERHSDWSVELSYGKRGKEYSDMLSLGVSIPLQLNRGNRQNREVAARLALVSAAKSQRDDLYREHVAEVRTMIDEWKTARERQGIFQHDLLPLSGDRIVAAEAAYRGGKLELAQLIAARRDWLDVSLQALDLESEIATLWARLSFMAASVPVAKEGNSEVTP